MIRPGPTGTSCLTCKQRHKKCDLRVPTCERCEKGGFECLGYGHLLGLGSSGRPRSGSGDLDSLTRKRLLANTVVVSAPTDYTRQIRDESSVDPASDMNTHPQREGLPLCTTRPTLQYSESPMFTFQQLTSLYAQLPRHTFDPLKTFLNSPSLDEYLLKQYSKLVDQWYFRPADIPKQTFQACIASVLHTSIASFSRWIALIGLGICEAFVKGDVSHNRLHGLWMEYIGKSLERELSYGSTVCEAQSRRDWLHVSLLRTLIIHNSDLYRVLRSITPAFLQSAFSLPGLWPSGSNPAYVPLMGVLTAGSPELAYFALIDCTCAMAFGLPHLVEYDTTVYPSPGSSLSHQWAHGSPTEFQVVLAEINACRDGSPHVRDWRDIERWLLAWQSRPGEHTFTESWMTVAWYAVQESWRLALLVYLYLAVCGTPSDDPRIQSYVKQILLVIGTVKPRGSTENISFFVQYLVVGICARSEAHRKVVRDKLSAHKGARFWLHRASDFVPVLDHLWHGAGADGRRVQWSDYMRSREAILLVAL